MICLSVNIFITVIIIIIIYYYYYYYHWLVLIINLFFAEINFGEFFAESCGETVETRADEQDRV